MRCAIGDEDGNLFGLGDIDGVQWQTEGDTLYNITSVSVQSLHRGGVAVYFSLLDSNDNILSPNGKLVEPRRIGIGDTLTFRPGMLRISFAIVGVACFKLGSAGGCTSGDLAR